MSKETRNAGLAFLLSILIVGGITYALNALINPVATVGAAVACQTQYTVHCLL